MNRCYGCMKYGIIYVAFIFLLTGIAIVSLSIYILARQEIYTSLGKDNEFLRYVTYSLLAGSLMLVGGIVGCCGGIKQSSLLLGIFFAIVFIISLAEIAAGVYAYTHKEQFEIYFRKMMTDSAQKIYGQDPDITKGWDLMQRELQCCGATNFQDFKQNSLQPRPKASESSENGFIDMTLSASASNPFSYSVPESCCRQELTQSECEKARLISQTSIITASLNIFSESKIYDNGCADKIIEIINEHSPCIVGVLIGIGSIQIFCLLFTCILICAFRSRRSYKN